MNSIKSILGMIATEAAEAGWEERAERERYRRVRRPFESVPTEWLKRIRDNARVASRLRDPLDREIEAAIEAELALPEVELE